MISYPHTRFAFSSDSQRQRIAYHFQEIMKTLGMDLTDESLVNTPDRVAKMYIDEVFSGLRNDLPDITVMPNTFGYDSSLTQINIKVHSFCEHHFVPIIGVAHVSYIPGEHVIGLSKLNRIVEHFARRPQMQERLTCQIAETLQQVLKIESVGVVIDAIHMCVKLRGVKHGDAMTRTSSLRGEYKPIKSEYHQFMRSIPRPDTVKL